jgi:tetratricopeptide (TPR) repeat protein
MPGFSGNEARSSLIHREFVQLAVLVAVAIGGFFLTRVIAANNREMRLRDAAEWYQRGRRQLDAGDVDEAIESLRHATLRNRTSTQYVRTLADALARAQQFDAARSALVALRESAPEDPAINLQLGRLAVDRGDVTEATRYYHNALYAPWSADQADQRREVRLELVHVLLTHGQPNRAVAELVAVAADLPDDAVAHVRIGQLFSAGGDRPRALQQFERALRIDPDNGAALAGAGQAAFSLGDYAAAGRFLRRAPDDIAGVGETRDIVNLMITIDPLGSRIGLAARRQRLADDLAYADERAAACLAAANGPSTEGGGLRNEVRAFMDRLKRSRTLEADTIEAGLDLVDRIEQRVTRRCQPAPRDRALVLIGRLHGVDAR